MSSLVLGVTIWLGFGVLFTLALCSASSTSIPRMTKGKRKKEGSKKDTSLAL